MNTTQHDTSHQAYLAAYLALDADSQQLLRQVALVMLQSEGGVKITAADVHARMRDIWMKHQSLSPALVD